MTPGSVNTQTGNRLATMPIIGWKTKGGLMFGLTLYHNAQENADLGWGQNWRSNYDYRVIYTGNTVNGNRDYLTVIYPSGKRLTFTRQKIQTNSGPLWGSTFYPPKGYYDTVFVTQASTYAFTLRTPDQMVYRFDASGTLLSENDRFGNAVTLTHSGRWITKVTDASGRSLSITNGSIMVGSSSGFAGQMFGYTSVKNDQSNQVWTLGQGGMNNVKYLQTVYLPSVGGGNYQHKFQYSASGAMTAEVDTMNKLYSFTYDSNLRLKTFRDPLSHTYTYTYNASNTVLTKPDGKQTTDNYDTGVLHSVKDEAGFGQTFAYDADYNLQQLTDERGNIQRYEYDAFGNCTSTQDPLQYAASKKQRTSYNSYNDVMSQTDTRGAVTTISRNPSTGVLLSVTDGLGNTLSNDTYDSSGNLTSISKVGATTSATYDIHGNLKTVGDPDGTTTLSYGDYFCLDQPTQSVDSRGRTNSLTHDEWGRLILASRSDGATMTVQYDAMDRVTKLKDWLGRQTIYTYDDAGRLTARQDGKGSTEHYVYDACDRLTATQDGRGNSKNYVYSVRGEIAGIYLADGAYDLYQYDGAGNQTSRRNGLGQVTYYDYDTADNLWRVRYPSGTPTVFVYDLDGRQISMTDATGVTTYTYDLGDRQTALTSPQGNVSYQYDQWGRRTLLTQGTGDTIQTNYSNEKVLSTVKMPENEVTSWSYDSYGRLSTQTRPNGTVTTFGYDTLDRVNSILHSKSAGAVISSETYQYDAGGNLTYKIVDGVRTDYGYDAIDQLISEVSPGRTIGYAYDAAGNRSSRTLNGSVETYTYDVGDKLLSRTGGPTGSYSYGYDNAGRTTSVTSAGGTTLLSYDYDDRLIGISGSGASASYTYNGQDARVGKSGTSGNRTYKRDGAEPTDPILSDGVSTMVPGISERTGGVTKFSHMDRLGTNSVVTDASQNVVNTRSYDAFGMLTSISGTPGTQKGFAAGFGYQEDGESGLKLLGERYYDSATGRFITRDPVGDGTNWYTYCDNNPLSDVDPSGEIHIVVTIGPDGLGIGKEYADPGDLYVGDNGLPQEADGGELIATFPVSNRPAGNHAPYPDGTRTITGVEHQKRMGGNYPVTRGRDGGAAKSRGTWLHSYDKRKRKSGKNWKSKTYGCCRTEPEDLDVVCMDLIMNRHRNNRLSVTHTGKSKKKKKSTSKSKAKHPIKVVGKPGEC